MLVNGYREDLLDLMKSGFTVKHKRRAVGAELEYLLVRPDGTMGSAEELLKAVGSDWQTITTEDGLTERRHDELGLLTTDAGIGTIEWNALPRESLFELQRDLKLVQREILNTAALTGQSVLNYGIQPFTKPDKSLWAPKKRYQLIIKRFSPAVHVATTTASVQVHVDVASDEACDVLRVSLALSGLIIALAANSPFHRGAIDRKRRLAVRAEMWDSFSDQRRVGITDGSFNSFEAILDHLLGSELFLYRDPSGQFRSFDGSLDQFLHQPRGRRLTRKELNQLLCAQICSHWQDGRLKHETNSAEFRGPDQGPLAMAIAALCTGMTESWKELDGDLVSQYSWPFWQHVRKVGIYKSLNGMVPNGSEPVSLRSLALILLTHAHNGLVRRNLREEKLLKPLWDIVQNPGLVCANQALKKLERRGTGAFLESIKLRAV